MTLTIKSSIRGVTDIEVYVKDLFERHNLEPDLYPNILISLTEAVTNAIKHGNHYDTSKVVSINTLIQTNKLCCIIKDEGTGFDYSNLPDPTAPENIEEPGGRGVFLMQQLSDGVIFRDNGSTVEIEFRI